MEEKLKHIVIVLACIIAFFPIGWIIITSLKTRFEVYTYPPTFIPYPPTLRSYYEIYQARGNFKYYALNSVIVTIISTFFTIGLGTFASYSFSRFKFKFNEFFLLLFLTTRMIPPMSLAVPFYIIMKKLGLVDTKYSLILMYTVTNLPLAIWLLKGFFDEIPQVLEDAAKVDGCSRFTALTHITLPLSRPGLAAAFIFTLIICWNEFLFARIFTLSTASKTLPVGIAELLGAEYELDWGNVSAAATTIILPMFFFAVFLQKHIVKGILGGAVKG